MWIDDIAQREKPTSCLFSVQNANKLSMLSFNGLPRNLHQHTQLAASLYYEPILNELLPNLQRDHVNAVLNHTNRDLIVAAQQHKNHLLQIYSNQNPQQVAAINSWMLNHMNGAANFLGLPSTLMASTVEGLTQRVPACPESVSSFSKHGTTGDSPINGTRSDHELPFSKPW